MGYENTVSTVESTSENYDVRYEPEHQLIWSYFKYPGRPCISRGLLEDLEKAHNAVIPFARHGHQAGDTDRLLYQVVGSTLPGVFNLGGDLGHFRELIRSRNREGLAKYGKACIDILYPFHTGYGLPFTTICLVQGEALGGGFEIALASKVLIAERSAKFGLPETMFGLFPGMGAFSFLARKLNPSLAKRMIASGKVYTAEELYEMGIVDYLAEDGEGEKAVYDYIKHHKARSAGNHCFDRVMDEFNPVSYDELIRIVNIWAEAAVQLTEKNLRVMDYLVRAQERRWGGETVQAEQQAAG